MLLGLLMLWVGANQFLVQKDLKFNSKNWKDGGGENITENIRNRMVNNLIEMKILLNKNETKIEELIGTPEKLNNNSTSKIKHYPVQEKYGCNIDPEEMIFLEIHYNNKGQSNSVKLISTK